MTRSCIVFRVGTRGSELARRQTAEALSRIADLVPALAFETVMVATPGDRDRVTDLRGTPADFFTRDLDEALERGEIDCAIHSAKDLPEPVPSGLDWVWLPWRAERRDCLVLAAGRSVDDLPVTPRIGVSSDRRIAWTQERLPDARCVPIRGDIDVRLALLDSGDFDGVVMAGAALERLGRLDRVTEWIPLADLSVPIGQGALALTFRAGDARMLALRALFVPAVRFVGAGIGDRRWITAAGIDALEHADVCLYDALLDPRLLDHLPVGAEAIAVGKRCGDGGVMQGDIDRLIVDRARRGERVVRLKGGDPGIFGRLVEELDACTVLGLPVEVMPGISSLQLATTGTGRPLTCRGVAQGFTAITPRVAGGGRAPLDATTRGDLPFTVFMGGRFLEDIVDELLADGMADETPATAVFAAGGSDEEIIEGSLATIAQHASFEDLRPMLLLVGATAVRRQPLCGCLAHVRVLVTASAAVQPVAARHIRDHGGIPVALPLIELTTTAAAREGILALADHDWLVVTSPSAADLLVRLANAAGIGHQHFPRLVAAGPGTARSLAAHGLHPDAVPRFHYGATGIIDALRGQAVTGETVLLPRSTAATSALPNDLRALGLIVDAPAWFANEAIVHQTLPPHDAVLFASASAVRAFVLAWGTDRLPMPCLAIGPPTAAALEVHGIDAIIASAATVAACVDALAGVRLADHLERMP